MTALVHETIKQKRGNDRRVAKKDGIEILKKSRFLESKSNKDQKAETHDEAQDQDTNSDERITSSLEEDVHDNEFVNPSFDLEARPKESINDDSPPFKSTSKRELTSIFEEIDSGINNEQKEKSEQLESFERIVNIVSPVKKGRNRKEPEKTNSIKELTNKSSFLEDSIFRLLPNVLKNCVEQFTDNRERDVFLIGAIGVLSACFPKVSLLYRRSRHWSNLNTFVVGPAASGKHALSFAKQLVIPYHEHLISSGQKLLVSGNSSVAAICDRLRNIKNGLLICETEADTLANAFKNDWGNYSDMLRKAFHHETISADRKDSEESFEVPKPKLSSSFSGTGNQVPGILHSAEDDLFSRMIFYSFLESSPWERWDHPSETPAGLATDLDNYFYEKGKYLMGCFLKFQENDFVFAFSLNQHDLFQDKFEKLYSLVRAYYHEDMQSVVKRFGLITHRIALILSVLRAYEESNFKERIVCQDKDFRIAISMVETFFNHSSSMFKALSSNSSKLSLLRKRVVNFFNQLPKTYTRQQMVKKMEGKCSAKTVYNYNDILEKEGFDVETETEGVFMKLE